MRKWRINCSERLGECDLFLASRSETGNLVWLRSGFWERSARRELRQLRRMWRTPQVRLWCRDDTELSPPKVASLQLYPHNSSLPPTIPCFSWNKPHSITRQICLNLQLHSVSTRETRVNLECRVCIVEDSRRKASGSKLCSSPVKQHTGESNLTSSHLPCVGDKGRKCNRAADSATRRIRITQVMKFCFL